MYLIPVNEGLSFIQITYLLSHGHTDMLNVMCTIKFVSLTFTHMFSYELVRSLNKQLDAVIDPLVESRIEERVLEGDGHRVVPHITEEVLNSSE